MSRTIIIFMTVSLLAVFFTPGVYAAGYGDQFTELDNITKGRSDVSSKSSSQHIQKLPNVLKPVVAVKGNYDMPGYTLLRSGMEVEAFYYYFQTQLLRMYQVQGAYNTAVNRKRGGASEYCSDLVDSSLVGAEILPVMDNIDVQMFDVTAGTANILITLNYKCFVKQAVQQ